MAGDWYPSTDGGKVTFLNNFATALATVGPTVGMDDVELMAINAARTALQAAIADKVAKKTAAQSSTAAYKTTDQATEGAMRAYVRRIKAHAGYTPAIGEQLGIVAAEDEPAGGEEGVRPNLRAESILSGEVTIGFAKVGHTGVEIRSKRGAETAFSFLARDTESPYVDTRANLSAAPEKREYVAQFLEKDSLVGELSDALIVTVPGV
jgi:hypothetical protein